MGQGVLARYRDFLPVTSATPIITLGEGSTPLVRSVALEKELGCGELYFKLEGCNPTGSFKDRGMVVAIAKAVEAGSQSVICASTGNTSASAAAYGARFGLDVVVIIPRGKIALGKLAQAIAYGARIIAIQGNFDEALRIVRSLVDRHPVTLVNSLNPNRIEGQKTAAFEIVDDLGDAPDYFFIPVGNAGNITAYWKGYKEYRDYGKTDSLPRILGFQASGAAPLVEGHPFENPETIATAIRIGNPARWSEAIAAAEESNGLIEKVSDDEIIQAYKMLARIEGIFVEPASAACIAGLFKLNKLGFFNQYKKQAKNLDIVCVLTGHGLKDPDVAIKQSSSPRVVPPEEGAILEAAGLKI